MVVRFREVGLPPGTTTVISVAGQGGADVRTDGGSGCLASSEVAASAEAMCVVDAGGVIVGALPLRLAAVLALPDPQGIRVQVRWTFFVIVRDLDTGAVAYLTGAVDG